MKKKQKQIPFEFIFEELDRAAPYTRPMFGAVGVYIGEKIIFILRDRPTSTEDNGVWLATTGEHHQSLQKVFPNMRSLKMLGPGPTGWQILPMDADDFEESTIKACQLVLKNDVRIGKVPKTKLRSSKKIKP